MSERGSSGWSELRPPEPARLRRCRRAPALSTPTETPRALSRLGEDRLDRPADGGRDDLAVTPLSVVDVDVNGEVRADADGTLGVRAKRVHRERRLIGGPQLDDFGHN